MQYEDVALGSFPDDVEPATYLDQLRALLEKREKHAHEINKKGLKLLDHCIEARFLDCRSAGREEEARELIKSYRA